MVYLPCLGNDWSFIGKAGVWPDLDFLFRHKKVSNMTDNKDNTQPAAIITPRTAGYFVNKDSSSCWGLASKVNSKRNNIGKILECFVTYHVHFYGLLISLWQKCCLGQGMAGQKCNIRHFLNLISCYSPGTVRGRRVFLWAFKFSSLHKN